MNDKKIIMVVQKNAEKTTNKIRIPQKTIEKMGNEFYMKIYEDKIILIPVKEMKRG